MGHNGPEFADRVRIRRTDLTERAGVAGAEGQVYGWTTPSITGVTVIGSRAEDFAVNVHVEATNNAYWLAADLVEFLDHAEGTEVQIGSKQWVREAGGEWKQRGTGLLGVIRRLLR